MHDMGDGQAHQGACVKVRGQLYGLVLSFFFCVGSRSAGLDSACLYLLNHTASPSFMFFKIVSSSTGIQHIQKYLIFLSFLKS